MPNQKILIVDDEPFNIDYLEQELEELNYTTISASNGQEALDQVTTESPDLILLDIMMPVMDGFEVLKHLKNDPDASDIPVIVISANNDLQSVVKGIQLGADDYLPKPFEPTLLKARINSCLEKKQLHDLQTLYLKGLEREFEIAHEIQMGFLPSSLPMVEGWEIAAYFKAAHEVAGDYYDAFLLPDGNLFCVVGDVCGKGVGAALYMTLFRSLIRATATSPMLCSDFNSLDFKPAQRLEQIISFTNGYITDTHGDESTFSTLFIGIIDLTSGILTYVNCGNEPSLLLRMDNEVIPLRSTGPVVGVFPEAKYTASEIPMRRGDVLLSFTDGIPDALNEANIAFGNERLRQLLGERNLSANELLNRITTQLHQFMQGAIQFDDITLMAIKRNS